MSTQWITINPATKEGVVIAPLVPGAGSKYKQVLEWSALRQLCREVFQSGAGDLDLNAIYIEACEKYCKKWDCTRAPRQLDPGPSMKDIVQPEPPQETE